MFVGARDVITYTEQEYGRGPVGSPANLRKKCISLKLNVTLPPILDMPMRALKHLAFSDVKRVLTCDVPFSTSRGWMFVVNNRPLDHTNLLNFGGTLSVGAKKSRKNKIREMGDRLEKFFSFLVVRHPFERLVSMYKKFDLKKYINTQEYLDYILPLKIYMEMMQETRANKTLKVDITFKHFIKFVINSPSHFYPWKTLYEACLPCTFNYRFIAYYEWDMERKDALAKHLGVTFSKNKRGLREEATVKNWWKYYDNISDTDLIKLREMYKNDFDLFGYVWPLDHS